MAEALTTVSAVASVIHLIEFAAKIITRFHEFQSHASEVPKAFRSISVELPILKVTVQHIEQAVESDSIAPAFEAATLPALRECIEALQVLNDYLEKLTPRITDSWGTTKGKALISLLNDSDIEKKIKRVRQLVRSLTFASLPLKSYKVTTLARFHDWVTTFCRSAPDPTQSFWENKKKRFETTGVWFLHSSQFHRWMNKPQSIVWLYGIPGCGKSVLSSSIIDELKQRSDTSLDIAVAYFYFSFNDVSFRDPHGMIKSLLWQLSSYCIKPSTGFNVLRDPKRAPKERPTLDVSLDFLRLLIEELPDTFVILDALDECQQRTELLEVLRQLVDWKLPNLHLLLTSRRERDIEKFVVPLLEPQFAIQLRSKEVDQDIQAYVRHRIAKSKWQKNAAICAEIETSLCSRSQGMFRWAACQMDALCQCLNRLQVRKTLQTLPKDLDGTYERILLSIDETYAEYALRAIRWLACSARPLSLGEVAEAMALDTDRETAFDEDERLEDPMDVFTLCQSLVTPFFSDQHPANERTVSPNTPIVLSHFSVHEYLTSERICKGPAAKFHIMRQASNVILASSCISYLVHLQEQFHQGHDFGLVRYSLEFWHHHLSAAELTNREILVLLNQFLWRRNAALEYTLSQQSGAWCSLWDIIHLFYGITASRLPVTGPLRFASEVILAGMTRFVLNTDRSFVNFSTQIPYRFYPIGSSLQPLVNASASGNLDAIDLFLKAGAELHGESSYPGKSSSLLCAIESSVPAAADRLLHAGATLHFKTGLLRSIQAPTPGMLRILLMRDVEGHLLEDYSECMGTPSILHFVARKGFSDRELPLNAICEEMLLLMNHGASFFLHTIDDDGYTPLHYLTHRKLADSAALAIAQALLSHGADVNAQTLSGSTVLHLLIHNGDLDRRSEQAAVQLLSLLLAYGLDVDKRDSQGRTALHLLARRKPKTPAMNLLLSAAKEIDCKDPAGDTPLHMASRRGLAYRVQMLLDAGANVNRANSAGSTPLHLVCRAEKFDEETCRILLVGGRL